MLGGRSEYRHRRARSLSDFGCCCCCSTVPKSDNIFVAHRMRVRWETKIVRRCLLILSNIVLFIFFSFTCTCVGSMLLSAPWVNYNISWDIGASSSEQETQKKGSESQRTWKQVNAQFYAFFFCCSNFITIISKCRNTGQTLGTFIDPERYRCVRYIRLCQGLRSGEITQFCYCCCLERQQIFIGFKIKWYCLCIMYACSLSPLHLWLYCLQKKN